MELSSDDLAQLVQPTAIDKINYEFSHESRIKNFPTVHYGEQGTGGRGLFASQSAEEGATLVVENAVVWQVGDENGTVYSAIQLPDADATMWQMAPFCLTLSSEFLPGEPLSMSRRQLMQSVMQANCFELQSRQAAGDAALFPIICLSNHSCAPNAIVQQVIVEQDGSGQAEGSVGAAQGAQAPPTYALSARRSLTSGEEILISYLPRTWPKAKRQRACQELWKFTCACLRCSEPCDDTIVLRMSCCPEGRAYFPDPPRTEATCLECGRVTDIRGSDQEHADAESTLGDVSISGDATAEQLAAIANSLLQHPVLAPDDGRVFSTLNGLASLVSSRLTEAMEAGDASAECAALQGLFERLMGHVATVALRSRFVTPQDLGLCIEVESG